MKKRFIRKTGHYRKRRFSKKRNYKKTGTKRIKNTVKSMSEKKYI